MPDKPKKKTLSERVAVLEGQYARHLEVETAHRDIAREELCEKTGGHQWAVAKVWLETADGVTGALFTTIQCTCGARELRQYSSLTRRQRKEVRTNLGM